MFRQLDHVKVFTDPRGTEATMLAHEIGPILDTLATEHADMLPCTAHLSALATEKSPELHAALDRCWPVLTGALDAHIEAEDTVLFPALANEVGDGITGLFRDEHREIEALRASLRAARLDGDDLERVSSIALRLAELLGSHMNREDAMLFPSARNVLR